MDERVEPAAGLLLVASVDLRDGVFDQTVVLLLDHDDSGTLGVVLNRVSRVDLGQVLPQWVSEVSLPQALYAGGPVSPNGAICLASLGPGQAEPPGWRRLFHEVGLLHLDTPVEIVRGAFRDLRIYAGYAGWAAGQLDAELRRGAWHVVPALYDDIFGDHYADLWQRVLHRQGNPLAFFATWTASPQHN
ncbi:MAG: YqgE/AlgH family protein [Actinomycetia bacterium]|nr:YqgE/AlgH family protein [Actinomycetes bacterium]